MRQIWLLRLCVFHPLVGAETEAEKAAAILRQNCVACHGAAMQMSRLDLRTRESMLAGGEHGPAGRPGTRKSRFYRFVAGIENPRCLPANASDDQVATFRSWIEEGASFPVAATLQDDEEPRSRSRGWKSAR